MVQDYFTPGCTQFISINDEELEKLQVVYTSREQEFKEDTFDVAYKFAAKALELYFGVYQDDPEVNQRAEEDEDAQEEQDAQEKRTRREKKASKFQRFQRFQNFVLKKLTSSKRSKEYTLAEAYDYQVRNQDTRLLGPRLRTQKTTNPRYLPRRRDNRGNTEEGTDV